VSNSLRKVTPDDVKFKVFHKLVVIATGTVITAILSYALVATLLNKLDAVGVALVDVEFPSAQYFPIYGKPISYLIAAAVALTYSGYELIKPWLSRQSNVKLSMLKLLAFVGSVLSVYEVFYNFAIWTAQIGSTVTAGAFLVFLSPDQITNPFPNPNAPWNLVFATKLSVFILGSSVYSFFVFRQIEREKEPLRLTPILVKQLRELEARLRIEEERATLASPSPSAYSLELVDGSKPQNTDGKSLGARLQDFEKEGQAKD
jgi:hypothetical protein